MLKNKRQNRRTIITVSIMLGLALLGLVLINTERVDADRLSHSALTAVGDNAAGAEATTSEHGYGLTDASPMSAIVKMMAALALVIAAVYGVLWFLRRMMGRKYGRQGQGRALEVLESAYVGPHKTVSLVRVGKRSVLVGVTEQQVSILTELDSEETDQLLERESSPQPQPNFAGMLSTAADKIREFGLKRRTALES